MNLLCTTGPGARPPSTNTTDTRYIITRQSARAAAELATKTAELKIRVDLEAKVEGRIATLRAAEDLVGKPESFVIKDPNHRDDPYQFETTDSTIITKATASAKTTSAALVKKRAEAARIAPKVEIFKTLIKDKDDKKIKIVLSAVDIGEDLLFITCMVDKADEIGKQGDFLVLTYDNYVKHFSDEKRLPDLSSERAPALAEKLKAERAERDRLIEQTGKAVIEALSHVSPSAYSAPKSFTQRFLSGIAASKERFVRVAQIGANALEAFVSLLLLTKPYFDDRAKKPSSEEGWEPIK